MKKHLLGLFLLLTLPFAASAQEELDKQIGQIRQVYTDLAQKIEAAEKNEESGQTSEIAVNELIINKLNRSWAAVGNYRVVYRFYYQNKDEEPYPTELLKVTRHADVAARRYSEEFVYGATGDLIFYFERSEDDETPLERRVYFAKGRAIRLVEDKTSRDKLYPDDAKNIREILERSGNVRQIFVKSILD